ncbi:MAG: bifunctional tRNA (5-methylaminomethyl-2-thiouridine)(34)-methyltransferase MnmD/FAD-dependent 5-carboxymethylaminomethyl-2-thiouridine(34) oxidoreductase MnmC [Gammaproteobacteria bacterium]|nr:bifunctional tRNA (5-methylaminomethyl-2-thiouridine)(34)-methyltransferase MnmD/FAD-dependent 5-carboxymethylaminomethyl-2-thiouridine(34) oxidoreductase MnmC [Gammaproteobacteria bacterium]
MSLYQPVQTADIDWRGDAPSCRTHGDIYFSAEGGEQEAEYVFLQGNHLAERWRISQRFTIAETGFGIGLNFLVTAGAWLEQAPQGAVLRYLSAESRPLKIADLKRAHDRWPRLKAIAYELQRYYPSLCHGHHQRSLFGGRIELTLMLGEAVDMYTDIDHRVDAWYLDGFAPAKNPAMWNEDLFRQVGRLSCQGTSFATFTAAGVVRRGLEAVGFETQRPSGFGRKRNMLTGIMAKPPAFKSTQPWFHFSGQPSPPQKAIVIGGGFAGCSISHELAQRGWQVELIERHPAVGREASGNLAGVVMPRLSADMDVGGQFYLAAFLYSQNWLNSLGRTGSEPGWHQSGVLQLELDRRLEQLSRLQLPPDVLMNGNASMASEICGLAVKRGGVFFPLAGWLQPPFVCEWLVENQKERIRQRFMREAMRIEQTTGGWRVMDGTGERGEAPVLIVANAGDAERLLPDQTLSLQTVRGQVSYLKPGSVSRALKVPVCFDGYLLPVHHNHHCAGASYDPEDRDPAFNLYHSQQVQQRITAELGGLGLAPGTEGRVAFRASCKDHLPLIGPVVDPIFFRENYSDLHHGRAAGSYPPVSYLPGLYISSGHGSRGLVSCPFAARLLADLICDGQSNIARSLQQAVHPARFMLRKYKRSD